MILKPTDEEFASFYSGYVGKVEAAGPRAMLDDQIATFTALRTLPEDKANYRYADGKWTVKELLGHMADTERVFGYRLLRIARNDQTPLAGFDENAWAATAPHAHRVLRDIADEMIAVRRATLALIWSLDQAAISRQGLANNKPITARAIVWIIAGHAQHHLDILKDRYGLTGLQAY
jgi:uncharacterized damage-inducible protein DinB